MFRGCHILSIDGKGRLAVPSRFRERLNGDDNSVVLTIKPMDPCLLLYPKREWLEIERRLSALSDFEEQPRITKQMIIGHATDCPFDSAGRILPAPQLREYAGLAKQVALVGLVNRFEIWNEEVWHKRRAKWIRELQQNPEALSEAMRSLTL